MQVPGDGWRRWFRGTNRRREAVRIVIDAVSIGRSDVAR
jgi:hypothetical protein